MEEIKVLGATDRVIKAIKMIEGSSNSQFKVGETQADFHYKEEQNIEEFDHPFKLKILKENNSDYLNITSGRVLVNTIFSERAWVLFEDQYKLPLSGINSAGDYQVMLMVQFKPHGQQDPITDNTFFDSNVYFVTKPSDTSQVVNARGIVSIILGELKVKDVDNKRYFYTSKQNIFEDQVLSFQYAWEQLSIVANTTAFTNGSVKDSYTLADFHFYVNDGSAVVGENEIHINSLDFTTSTSGFVYCSINTAATSGALSFQSSDLIFYDSSTSTYNYKVGLINFDQGGGLMIHQYINGGISCGADTFKVKTIEQDAEAGFLSAKFQFSEMSNDHQASAYLDSYIGAEAVSGQADPSGTTYSIRPIWTWKDIPDFDDSKEQYLTSKQGNLKWREGSTSGLPVELSGSIKNIFETVSSTLRIKTEYDNSINQFHFLNLDSDGKLSAYTFSGTDSTNGEEALVYWNYDQHMPSTLICNDKENDTDFILAGNKDDGLYWANLQEEVEEAVSSKLSGDLYKVMTSANDPVPGYLSDELISQNLSIAVSVFDTGTDEVLSLDIDPSWFTSSDNSIKIEDNGTSLDFTTSGSFKVAINQQDQNPDFLVNKITVNAPLSLTVNNGRLEISLNVPSGAGILMINNGVLSVQEIEDGVMVGDNGSITFVETDECE